MLRTIIASPSTASRTCITGFISRAPISSFPKPIATFRRSIHATPSLQAADPKVSMHPKTTKEMTQAQEKAEKEEKDYLLRHPVYTKEELQAVSYTHKKIQGVRDAVAFSAVRVMSFSNYYSSRVPHIPAFDSATNYSDKVGAMTEKQWLNRICFLETVAGVPGMVAGMARHMRSLRSLKRDNGWIITLLEEAENERMHLLTFMKLKQASPFFRLLVLLTQGVFFNFYFLAYILSPKACHTFVGYLEESAVHTYTHCLKDIEMGQIKHWGSMPAPEIAKNYWRLKDDATVKDVVAAVRADEADHRDTNHMLSTLSQDQANPLNG
ncbi:hypothetical protein HDU97_001437 [Phlyctochytrium planicorne]|nr:hypothetical protein HDU97_001437 [Phlyctochytrium planicorne]